VVTLSGIQPEPTDVDLQLHPGISVGHRDPRAPAPEAELGHGETVQGAIGHRDPAALEQHMDLGQRQALLDPGVDLFAVAGDDLP